MKNIYLFLVLMVTLVACNEHDYLEKEATIEYTKKNTTFDNVTDYVHFAKNGGNRSRSTAMNSITPSLNENGDTIAYIVNYNEGWEVLSNDRRTPMVLASSEKGSFNLDEIKKNDNLNSYWTSIEEELTALKETPVTENDTLGTGWNAYYIENEDIAEEDMVRTNAAYALPVPGQNGYWVVIDSYTTTTKDEFSERAITTAWHQRMNSYIPKAVNARGELENCLAGCTAIAGAQYLYYLHNKNNRPQYMVDEGTYDASTNEFWFFGESEDVWDYMADPICGPIYVHIFIGYVAKYITDLFGLSATYGDPDKLRGLINSYGYDFSWNNYSSSSIINLLNEHGALVAIASNSNGSSHAFIIDGYRTTVTETTTTYGWVGEDSNGMDTNLRDFEGNIIGYGITSTQTTRNTDDRIYMNWGQLLTEYNETSFNIATGSWSMGSSIYNHNRKVLH